MNEYIIITDSTADLPKDYLTNELGVKYIPLSYIIDGETYEDMSGLSGKEFFDKIREGAMPTTSQVNPEQARIAIEPLVKEGKDILYIGFSSALSGTFNSIRMAMEELKEEYPSIAMRCVDTLCASLGEGMLIYKAVMLKRQGKSLDEVADWVEKYKFNVCHNITVDDLHHLHRGGRLSKASAVLGSMIKIKPIIVVNDKGELQVVGKERGRKKSLQKIVDMAVEQSKGWENEIAMIVHGDCPDEAEYVANIVREKLGIQEILINCIGTVIGTHTGPGVVAVLVMGDRGLS